MKKILFVIIAVLIVKQSVFSQDAFEKISFNFDGLARIRYEFLNNNSSLGISNDERDYFRFKFSGGVLADFFSIFSVYGKATTESRSYIYNADGDTRYDINEVIIDSLFINFPKLLGTFDVKVGRIDLAANEYGEGFLFADGTPLDGSRTFYFNAARLRYTMPQSSIEFMTIYNSEFDELPVINSLDRKLNDSQESALVLYARSQITNRLYIEPYYIWKNEKTDNNILYLNKDVSINTIGSYLRYDLTSIAFRAQAAAQLGNYDDETGRAFGGYVYADLPLLNIFKPLSVGYIYLSGDDPNTKNVEAWNPLFSRYPWVSEILATLYSSESAVAYWTNLQLARIEANFKPYKKVSINTSYDFIYANAAIQNSTNNIFGDGLNRGNLIRCKISYGFSNNFGASALVEYFIPGDFYYKDAQDASFFRFEFAAKI
ncbi:MAG: alginate export family protein [Endomicrobium sp.]|jgi:hypothetical protein|nr:alginate export family protein [Endomicrobium sp.]